VERILEPLFLGLSSGSIYALVALSLVIVYRGTGHLNFAQGEMATLCVYLMWVTTTWGWPLWIGTIVAMVCGFAMGSATELAIVRPLARRSPLAVFVALVALFLGINALTSGRWGAPPQETIGSIFPNDNDDFVEIGGAVWLYRDIGTLLLMLVAAFALYLLFQKTKVGLAMRAVASNPDSSRLVGVPTGWILAGSWGLAGAYAALGGTLQAGKNETLTPALMFTIFVYASAAAVLGGLDSPLGAVIGGLGIGILENCAANWAPGWIGEPMKLSVALICIFIVLLFRPSGLFGTAKVERV
jgi:branched-chain amino acid transport system permease protein